MKILPIIFCAVVLALASSAYAQTTSDQQAQAAAQQQAAQQQLQRDQEKMHQDQQKLWRDQQAHEGNQQAIAQEQDLQWLELDQHAVERDQRRVEQDQQSLELNQQQLEKQMEQARQQMQQAAQRMAQLSLRMQGPMLSRLSHMFDPNHAILGVSIADSHGSQNATGVRVEAVTPGGPADKAGISAGDVITAINGRAFQTTPQESAADQLMDFMDKVKPGDALKLDYMRDGQNRSATLKAGRLSDYSFVLGEPPMPPTPPVPPVPPVRSDNLQVLFAPGWWGLWGNMQLVKLTPGLGRYFGTDQGLLVVRAPRDAALKLEDGDVILKIGDRKPTTPSEAVRILYSYSAGETIKLRILRKSKPLDLSVVVPKVSSRALDSYNPMSLHDP